MKSQPIETVVIRPALSLALPAPSCPEGADRAEGPEPAAGPPELAEGAGPEPVEEFSPDQQRELDWLLEAMQCPVRRRLMLLIAEAGRANVGTICGWMDMPQPTISHHLGILRMRGLVLNTRVGKCVWYECTPGHVRVDHAPSAFSLTLARANGVSLTLCIPIPAPPAAAAPAPEPTAAPPPAAAAA